MDMRRRLALSTGFVILLTGDFGAAHFRGHDLVSHEHNGRRIYMSGITSQGQVLENSHGMRGVGCVHCHGSDGRGGSMHGIPVPSITFSFLTDPNGYQE